MTFDRRILIADDDIDICGIVSQVLTVVSPSVTVVHDGLAAIAECEKNMPALLVLDLMMPGCDGFEVCRRVRALPGGALVPVLALTARDEINNKLSAFQDGVDDYLTKPFNYQELVARAKALLRVRDLSQAIEDKNLQLAEMQEKLVQKERQAVVGQLAGLAAHELGQPLSSIMLNLYLLETLDAADPQYKSAIAAIKGDSKRMSEILEQLQKVDADTKENYFKESNILKIKSEKDSQV